MVMIYAIYRTDIGRSYIGCTSGTLAKRFREHRCLLRKGVHKCSLLQHDWSFLPEDMFRIEAKEVLSNNATTDERRAAELKWIEFFKSAGLLYNEHSISFQPPEGAPAKAAAARVANGYRPSAEANEKRRLAQLGRPKGHGAKISATKRAKAMR